MKNKFIKYWLPVILYACLIFYLSSLQNPLEQIIRQKSLLYYIEFRRFVYHIIEYAIFNLLLYRALKKDYKNPQSLSLLITTLYAITDEMHQYFIPGRTSSVFDVAIDTFGAVAMQSIVNIYNWLKSR